MTENCKDDIIRTLKTIKFRKGETYMNDYSKVLGEMLQLGKRYSVDRDKLDNDLVYRAIVKFFSEQGIIETEQEKDIDLNLEECKFIFWAYQENYLTDENFLKKFNQCQLQEILLGLKEGLDISFYENPEFDWYQMKEIREGLQRGLDVKLYANPKFDVDQMQLIQDGLEQGVDVQIYAKTEFDSNQMFEILRGLHSKIDVSVYASPEFNSEQMAEIRLGLEIGLNVKEYAKPDIDARQMRMTRLRLWKEYM